MSDASVTPEPSMDEILQKIQRIIAEDEKPESAPAPTPPRSAEILTLTEAVGEGGTVRRLTPVETSPEPAVEQPPPPPERRIEAVASAPQPPPHPPGERLISDAAATAFEVPLVEFEYFRKQHPHAGERIMRNLAQLLADRLILANAKVNLLTSS